MTDLPKAYTPRDVEGAIYERWLAADVFAPDGAGSTADPDLPPFTIIQPPPNVTGSLHLGHAQRTAVEDLMTRHARMRGHAASVPARARSRRHRRPVRARWDPGQGRREPADARPGALPRAHGRLLGVDEAGDAGPAAAGRRLVRLGTPALHDGRGLGQGGPRRIRPALPRRPRVPHRSARQLVPGLPDQRQRPRGHPDARDGHAVVRPLPPRRRGDRSARSRSRAVDHGGHDPARDDPWRHGGGRPSRRCAVPRAGRSPGADPVRRSRRADHRRRRRRPRLRDRGREDHAGP